MECLVAVEKETAQEIVKALKRVKPQWEFHICSDANNLMSGNFDPDMIFLSRFLPGKDPIELLKNLKFMYYDAHIVLLVGIENEHQKAYIKAAHDNGLYNIVAGKLPGDRPYTIFDALNVPRYPELEGYNTVEEKINDKEDANTRAYDFNSINWGNEIQEDEDKTCEIADKENTKTSDGLTWDNAGEDETATENDKKPDGQKNKGEDDKTEDVEELKQKINQLEKIITMLNDGQGSADTPKSMTAFGAPQEGILVLSAANKGGVGKSTVAVTLSVALSRAGVPTVITDYDLASPNVAHFFDITDVPGIEAVAGRTVTPNNLSDLIVKKDALDILPGVMNRTFPKFYDNQLGEIIDTLKKMYAVVVCDTPPENWTKPWVMELFKKADYVLAVTDQSKLSEQDTKSYAPYLLRMGATPDKIGIVVNKYSPKLHNPRKIEKEFCAGFKKDVKTLPKVVAVIPGDYEDYVAKGYKSEVAGLDDANSQWHKLAENIARMAGYGYNTIGKAKKGSDVKEKLSGIFKKLEKTKKK